MEREKEEEEEEELEEEEEVGMDPICCFCGVGGGSVERTFNSENMDA
jgi:hypothetical protein